MLGWLLDFPKRPFNDRDHYGEDYEPEIPVGGSGPGNQAHDRVGGNPETVFNTGAQKFPGVEEGVHLPAGSSIRHQGRRKTVKWVGGILALLLTGWWLLVNRSNVAAEPGCMIWVDDHYEARNCDSVAGMGAVMKLDNAVLQNFRRITRPDTITATDINKLWYQKRTRDSLDFFTSGGKDPVNPKRYVRILSRYIFEHYLAR